MPDWTAFLSFALATTFSPGPNNLSSANMGVLYGFRRTFRYLLGISTGFLGIMLLAGLVSATLRRAFPPFEGILRLVGAAYILWLAYATLRASYTIKEDVQPLVGFSRGFFLQILNPKVVIYGLTQYSTFLAGAARQPATLILSALFLASLCLASVSLWAAFGSAIRARLRQPQVRRGVSIALSLLLIYTAVKLSGLV